MVELCQGKLVEKDFDISEKAGGVGKAYVSTHSVNVSNTLEIRLHWAGKGTTNIPVEGVYGPLISAISVDPSKPSTFYEFCETRFAIDFITCEDDNRFPK